MFADDYVSEAEALNDIYDGLDDYDNEDCTPKDRSWLFGYDSFSYRRKKKNNKKNKGPRDKAGRIDQLPDKNIESLRSTNKLAPVRTSCTCPICKQTFVKSSYQQTFCSSVCHNRYHKLRYK